jgi:hypothetical protein
MGATLAGANTVKSRPTRAISSEHATFCREQKVGTLISKIHYHETDLFYANTRGVASGFLLSAAFTPSHLTRADGVDVMTVRLCEPPVST